MPSMMVAVVGGEMNSVEDNKCREHYNNNNNNESELTWKSM